MYLCTDYLRLRNEMYFFHPDTTWVSRRPAGNYNINVDGYPEIFRRINKNDEYVWDLFGFFAGQQLIPKYSFDPDAYERNEYAFTRVDAWKLQWFRRNLRRTAIEEDIHKEVRIGTELKRHRLALEAIIEHLPESAKDDERIRDFLGMSEFIRSTIQSIPKDSSVAEERAFRVNGEDVHWWFETSEEAYQRAKQDEQEDRDRTKREKAQADKERREAARNKKK